jgi:hypothetical protein
MHRISWESATLPSDYPSFPIRQIVRYTSSEDTPLVVVSIKHLELLFIFYRIALISKGRLLFSCLGKCGRHDGRKAVGAWLYGAQPFH